MVGAANGLHTPARTLPTSACVVAASEDAIGRGAGSRFHPGAQQRSRQTHKALGSLTGCSSRGSTMRWKRGAPRSDMRNCNGFAEH